MLHIALVGVAVQPHVMSANGSGKTETEARVGMCYGNFIKRLLTIANRAAPRVARKATSRAPVR